MTLEKLIKIRGVVWSVTGESDSVLFLKRFGIEAKLFKATKNMVWRNKFSGQYMSRKVTL